LNPYPGRPDRLHATLALIVIVLAALCAVLYGRNQPASSPTVPPAAPEAATPRPAAPRGAAPGGTTEVVPAKGPPPEAAPPVESRRPGRVLGRVRFADAERPPRRFSYQIYLFGADGTLDGPKTFANSDRFELPGLSPGRKAVLFFSPTESLTCPYQVVVVPEGEDAQAELAPRKCRPLEGKLVDASGGAIGGLYVTASETVGLPQELYLEGKPASVARLEISVGPGGTTGPIEESPSEVPSQILRVHPDEGRVSRATIAGAQGRFSVPLSSFEVPVRLTVSRGPSEVIREEVVVPSVGAARIILPNQ